MKSPYGRNQASRLHDQPQPIIDDPTAPRPLVAKTELERMIEQLEAFNNRAERHVAALERIATALERPIEVTATAGDESVRIEVKP